MISHLVLEYLIDSLKNIQKVTQKIIVKSLKKWNTKVCFSFLKCQGIKTFRDEHFHSEKKKHFKHFRHSSKSDGKRTPRLEKLAYDRCNGVLVKFRAKLAFFVMYSCSHLISWSTFKWHLTLILSIYNFHLCYLNLF